MSTLTIIGFGRFGQTLCRLLRDDFATTVYSRSPVTAIPADLKQNLTFTTDISKAYSSDIIVYAVPISAFESVIKSHLPYIESRHQLLDVLSVKMHPAKVFQSYLSKTGAQIILTHPMFGPDSSAAGFANLPIVIHNLQAADETFHFWKRYFLTKHLRVIELTPEQHDKLAANSQGVTHFIGRLLHEFDFEPTQIDTVGSTKLHDIERQTVSDSWQLFKDLQHFNPYTKSMRLRLGEANDKVYKDLLPPQVDRRYLTIGIQGGKGSFNEEAIQYWLHKHGRVNYKIKYLFTSKKVFAALHDGSVDRGLVAIHNSVGGIVGESVEAMAKYKFKIIEEFAIKISHTLMMRDDADFQDLNIVMAHPQVFAQCQASLKAKYPQLERVSGKGNLIDHAQVAKLLGSHKLPKNIATMGSKVLANLYNLQIVETDLQDAAQNFTSFLLVSR
jgi:prephenate dehydrogenase